MSRDSRVLVFVHDTMDAEMVDMQLRKAHIRCSIQRVTAKDQFLKAMRSTPPDLTIIDGAFPRLDMTALMQVVLKTTPDVPFVVLTPTQAEDTVVKWMKAGASDVVTRKNYTRLGTVAAGLLVQPHAPHAAGPAPSAPGHVAPAPHTAGPASSASAQPAHAPSAHAAPTAAAPAPVVPAAPSHAAPVSPARASATAAPAAHHEPAASDSAASDPWGLGPSDVLTPAHGLADAAPVTGAPSSGDREAPAQIGRAHV